MARTMQLHAGMSPQTSCDTVDKLDLVDAPRSTAAFVDVVALFRWPGVAEAASPSLDARDRQLTVLFASGSVEDEYFVGLKLQSWGSKTGWLFGNI